MKLVDAALQVLAQFGDGRPMHYRQITEIAQEESLISPRGLTPTASMNAALSTAIARATETGDDPVFSAHGRGFYSLTKARASDEVEEAVRRSNEAVRRRLHAELREMDPRAFEQLIGRLLETLGFEDVEVTNYSSDGGIDVRGTLSVGGVTNVRTAIQVKRHERNIGPPLVQQLRGSLSTHERGLVITVGGFTKQARAEASLPDRPPISLVDGEKLVDLLVDNQLGVVSTPMHLLRLDASALLPPDEVVDEDSATQPGDELFPVTESAPSHSSPRRARSHEDGRLMSLWPLPGGRGNYVKSLTSMLEHIAEARPTVDGFIDWLMRAFPTVKSRKTAIGYLNVPRFAGLVSMEADQLKISADAAAYLSSTDPDHLLTAMSSRIAGLDETLERLRQAPATLLELTDYLNGQLGTEWQTDAQARWRAAWLESFGKARQKGDSWQAT